MNPPASPDDERAPAADRDHVDAVAALRRDAHLFYLDGAGVLFREDAQTLHLLNPAAALVCSLIQDGHDARSAARALQDLQGVDAAAGERLVAQSLAQWRAQGMLPLPPRAAAPVADAAIDSVAWMPVAAVEERCYTLLGSTFRIRFGHAEQARAVHPVLRHLEGQADAAAVAVDVVERDGRIAVYRDRELFAVCAGVAALAPLVKGLVWVTAVNRHEFLLYLHAGVIGDATACLLLPGAAGSGKSTLTAALVHDGHLLYSDEVALLADGTLDVVPVPLAICVKTSGIEALASRYPELRGLPRHDRADGKRVSYLSPPRERLAPAEVRRPAAALVFPTYSPGIATELVRIPAFEALRLLLDECLVLRSRLIFARVERLVTWVGTTPAYRLRYGAVDEAVPLVGQVFPRPASADGRPSAN